MLWKGIYGYGRVFFHAPSQQAAQLFISRWGQGFALGAPDTVKKCRDGDFTPPSADYTGGAYVMDRGVWLEQ